MRQDISGWNVQWDDARAAQWVAGGQWLNRTLADAVREAAETDPGRVTQLCGGREVTAGEVWDKAQRLAAALWARWRSVR